MVSANEINGCDDVGNFTDLQANVNSANGYFDLTRDYNNTDNHDSIVINKDIVINGNGHTIDANGKSGIFNIASHVTVTLNNVTFVNGIGTVKVNDNLGGAIYSNKGSKLHVINCHFIKNTAFYGGAIYGDKGSNINISDSIFINTTAEKTGGAVASYYYSNVTVFNSSFINTSASYAGGAISGLNRGILLVSDSTFINNTAYFAGAIVGFDNVHVAYSKFQNITSPNEGSIIMGGDVNLVYNDYNGKIRYDSTEIKGNVVEYIHRNDNFNFPDNSIKHNNTKINYYYCNISSEKDFKSLFNYLRSCNKNYEYVIINIIKDITISETNVLSANSNSVFTINGNGHSIKVSNPSERGENHFLTCGENGKVVIINLTFAGFNSAIINQGNIELDGVIFNSNRVDYIQDPNDIGGAIRNSGVLNCINCSFIKNYAKFGGAIFSNGTGSTVNLINCYFYDNEAYAESDIWHCFCSHFWNGITSIHNYVSRDKEAKFVSPGKDIFVGCGGTVYSYSLNKPSHLRGPGVFYTPNNNIDFGYDDSELGHTIVLRDSKTPIVREYIINNESDLQNVVNEIRKEGTNVDKFVINFTGNVNFKPWTEDLVLFNPQFGSILINGNGHNVNLLGARECDEYHFTTLNKNAFMVVNNLGISGFNCAIVNNGYACFNNVTFSNNMIKYIMESGDGGGAINNYAMVVCNNCTFINNFGLWAGAIYGAHGAQSYLNNCTFNQNTPSKDDGGELYSYNKAQFYLNYVELNSTIINDNNINIGYGQLPSGIKKVLYKCLDIITPIISFAVGFAAGFVTGNLGVGFGVGVTVATVLGVACNVGYRLYYAGLSHEFSYDIFTHLPYDIAIHFAYAISGATMGYRTSYDNVKSSFDNEMKKIINSNDNINGLEEGSNKVGVFFSDGSTIQYEGISNNSMEAISNLYDKYGIVVEDIWASTT